MTAALLTDAEALLGSMLEDWRTAVEEKCNRCSALLCIAGVGAGLLRC